MNATTTTPITAPTPIPCLECGRMLRSVKSVKRGRGAACQTKVNKAAKTVDLSDFKPAQVQSALDLIEDAAIVKVRPNVFRSVSTDGTAEYLTHPAACNCPAGLKSRNCYHRAAAIILLAA